MTSSQNMAAEGKAPFVVMVKPVGSRCNMRCRYCYYLGADNVMPVVIDCNNQNINSYMDDVADIVYGVLRHNYYLLLLLYQKYDIEIGILFQYVPNWIADDFDALGNIDDIGAGEIINNVLNNFSDFLTEFFVQVYQNSDDYSLLISHSNKYSDRMINDFKDAFISILSNIINTSGASDLSSIFK